MNKTLRALIVEDSENDAALLELELQRAGYDSVCQRVETREALIAALEPPAWDVVIADYVMPHFNGLAALALVKEKGLDLPFIIVSGHITEDTAVAAMKAGAHDYVMKDNLARLGSAVERELREAEVRRQRRRSEERLKVEHGITRVLAHAQTLDEAAHGILPLLLEGLEADAGIFWLIDSRRQALHPCALDTRSGTSQLKTFLDGNRDLSFTVGMSLPGRVWADRKPAWIADLAAQADFQRQGLASGAGLKTGMAFPIQSGGDFLGVLEFFSARRAEPDEMLLNMMTAIGSELGQFMKRRIAEEDLRRAHDELEMRVQERTAELKTANASLQTAINDRERLEHELLEITEKERRRIGLDLHDDLGQRLSGIAMMTKGLELKLTRSQASEAQDAAKIHNLVQAAMSHASGLARDLATLDLKEKSLPAALNGLAEHASKMFEISCKFKVEGDIPSLESNTINQLYKIAQEAVTNANKHGKAKKVTINLLGEPNELKLTIQNTGLRFPDLEGKSTGMGLRIMNYRASLVGATLEIKGAAAGGTRVTCKMPLSARK